MANSKLKIKEYPVKNPMVKGSTSMFSRGNEGDVEIMELKNFDVKHSIFKYNSESEEFSFDETDQKEKEEKIQPYLPSEDIKSLIRLGQILQRPILLRGEPGCGKTQLAKAVAFEWYGKEFRKHFFEWHIKSTSKAQDGLYKFDHLRRLRDANISEGKGNKDIKEYRDFGPLAKAFLTSTDENPSIILIDEIDKADIDFPNDLLLELDENRFQIPETGEVISAKHPPLVFITSNNEREMPEAFLRRCLFAYLKFPDGDALKEIVRAHIPGLIERHGEFVESAIKRFDELRKSLDADVAESKRISTSELLDWLKAYHHELKAGKINKSEIDEANLKNLPLYYQAVLKTYESLRNQNKLT